MAREKKIVSPATKASRTAAATTNKRKRREEIRLASTDLEIENHKASERVRIQTYRDNKKMAMRREIEIDYPIRRQLLLSHGTQIYNARNRSKIYKANREALGLCAQFKKKQAENSKAYRTRNNENRCEHPVCKRFTDTEGYFHCVKFCPVLYPNARKKMINKLICKGKPVLGYCDDPKVVYYDYHSYSLIRLIAPLEDYTYPVYLHYTGTYKASDKQNIGLAKLGCESCYEEQTAVKKRALGVLRQRKFLNSLYSYEVEDLRKKAVRRMYKRRIVLKPRSVLLKDVCFKKR